VEFFIQFQRKSSSTVIVVGINNSNLWHHQVLCFKLWLWKQRITVW